MNVQNISDEYLNSFIDDQLEPSETIQTFDAISQNDALKKRVCELRGLKGMMQLAYSQPPVYRQASAKQRYPSLRNYQTLTACLLLLLGGVSGWFSHAWTTGASKFAVVNLQQTAQPVDAITGARKIVIHLNDTDPTKFKDALDETEVLLDTYRRDKRQIQIEVIANQRGADLLRSRVSGYKERIGLLHRNNPNLKFIVCGQTIDKLRKNGENVQLLPHTETVPAAAAQINRRLLQGWGYISI